MNENIKKNYLVFGVFDLLHPGHINLLYRASQRGDVYVAIFSDEDVMNSKNKKPLYNQDVRLSMIKMLDFVKDAIIIEKDEHSKIWDFAKQNNVKFGLLGSDQDIERAHNWFKSNGVKLEITDRTEGISSTELTEVLLKKC